MPAPGVTNYGLPVVRQQTYDTLTTQAPSGFVGRRSRTRRPNPVEHYQVVLENLPNTQTLFMVALAIATKGAAIAITLALPDVGVKTVRFDEDGLTYTVFPGNQASLTTELVEEYRV